MISRPFAALVLVIVGHAGPSLSPALAAEDAVILMYHHVDTTTPPATSTTPEKFAAHLDYLAQENFTVLPLLEVLRSIETGTELPEKTVALTFDDGYVSVYETAFPLLSARGWPFTVFVSTDYVDRGFGSYLSWDQLRDMATNHATIGNHTRTHAHLVRQTADESSDQWRQRIRDEIAGAGQRLDAELGDAVIPVLAYPYGEYDTAVKEIVETLGLFALGQHSGATGPQSDLLAAPRYPLATGYDGLDDFALRVHSRALPARTLDDERHILADGESQPTLRLEISAGDFRMGETACYASNQGLMDLTWGSDDRHTVSVRPRQPLNAGRTKFNCTAPSASENGIYYWYSYLWLKKNDDGTWPEE